MGTRPPKAGPRLRSGCMGARAAARFDLDLDLDFSRDRAARDPEERFVQDCIDGGWPAAGRRSGWLDERIPALVGPSA